MEKIKNQRHSLNQWFVFRWLLLVVFAFSTPLLQAQTDRNGRSLSDDDIINNKDPNSTPEGRTTQVSRDVFDGVTDVTVTDDKGRTRRTIKITYNKDGTATFSSTQYLRDGSIDTHTDSQWSSPDINGRRTATERETYVYPHHPGKPPAKEPTDGWKEQMKDGHWVRVAVWRDKKWVPTGQPSPSPSPKKAAKKTLASLVSDKSVSLQTAGTGQTIGHIADFRIQNQTDQPISFVIPAMILESSSGKNQHYACPKEQTVDLGPKQSKTVPMDGVCINRHKPPVGKDVTGDLVINTGDPTAPQNLDSHVPAKDANKLLRIAKSKYDAADKLQKDGELKDLPYHDKQKQKDIVVQWSTWTDPDISEIVGGPPATKDDLKKVVYKQVEENGPMTPETKKKVDQGIDTIFEKVELTSKKAKDLEEPDQYAETEAMPPNTVEIGDHTGAPTTQERPRGKGKGKWKGKGKGKGHKKWPKPIQDWVDKKKAADAADQQKAEAYRELDVDLDRYCSDKSPHYRELKGKRDKAADKANAKDATQADKDNFKKLDDDLKKLRSEFMPDFAKTTYGAADYADVRTTEKAASAAHEAEKEAGKNIDPATKGYVEAEEAKSNAVEAVW